MASAYLVEPLPIVTARAPKVRAPATADPAALSKIALSLRRMLSSD